MYAAIAYNNEMKSKHCFLGKEKQEKVFHRWLKIFDTFIEGIALIRNNKILYANKNLLHTLEISTLFLSHDDKNHPLLRKKLAETEV